MMLEPLYGPDRAVDASDQVADAEARAIAALASLRMTSERLTEMKTPTCEVTLEEAYEMAQEYS